MRVSWSLLIALILLLSLAYPAAATYADNDFEPPPTISVRSRVVEVISSDLYHSSYGMDTYRDLVSVRVDGGRFRGQVVVVEHFRSGHPVYDFEVASGDRVLLMIELDGEEIGQAFIESPLRDHYLWYLAGLFVGLLVLSGGRQGLKAVLSLALMLFVGAKLLLPLLLRGYDPVILSVGAAALVSTLVLGVIGGPNRKTLTAIIGTTGGVAVAGMLAAVVGRMASLTGLSGEEAQMLMYIPQGVQFDFRGLLFAGIIISALGAVMDVGMSVASAMQEVQRVGAQTNRRALFASGMTVGRDIMGTMSNTLILAYAGGAIPLILLFMAYDTPMIRIANLDVIATEVVRALAGSVGLVLSVPITAAAGAWLIGDEHYSPTQKRSRRQERSVTPPSGS